MQLGHEVEYFERGYFGDEIPATEEEFSAAWEGGRGWEARKRRLGGERDSRLWAGVGARINRCAVRLQREGKAKAKAEGASERSLGPDRASLPSLAPAPPPRPALLGKGSASGARWFIHLLINCLSEF